MKHKANTSGRLQRHISKNFLLLSKYVPRNRKVIVKSAIAAVAIVAIAGAIPLPYTFTKDVAVSFATETKEDVGMELGDSKVILEGRDGRKTVNVDSLQSVWGRLFGLEPIQQKEVDSTIAKTPITKIVANGTKKYQYMLCSDGSSKSYTDEQFKDPNVGLTSKSEDYCKESNHGYKVGLSNSNPSNNAISSASRPTSTTQPDTSEADKINREVEMLRWCNEQDVRIGNEYIGKVQQAQAQQGISDAEFNAIVDPAYWKYSLNTKSLISSGCTISNPYPNFTRQ